MSLSTTITAFPDLAGTFIREDAAHPNWQLTLDFSERADGFGGGISLFFSYADALALASKLRIACGAEEPKLEAAE